MTARRTLLGAALAVLLAVSYIWWANHRDETAMEEDSPETFAAENVARGEYLTVAGNCMACHTARGGAAYAGGRAIGTPFGVVYSSNLTSDTQFGLGAWSASEFWRALHNGRSRDGRLLNPVFPYPHYSQVTREDAGAIYAYLRSLPAVAAPNRAHELRWPYGTQWALAIWRALNFQPQRFARDETRSAEWNRGAYLVRGLGHCGGCHSERNILGAVDQNAELNGGLIENGKWHAPSLHDPHSASVAHWSIEEIVRFLRDGRAQRATASGPMAEVILRSTQYLNESDLTAVATYLKALPQEQSPNAIVQFQPNEAQLTKGAEIYRAQCEDCHGESGEGAANAYPALANNRAVTGANTTNVIASVMQGGFAPATRGNPRPFGMPPFAQKLSESEMAAVISYVRQAWGNNAAAVSVLDVRSYAHGVLRPKP